MKNKKVSFVTVSFNQALKRIIKDIERRLQKIRKGENVEGNYAAVNYLTKVIVDISSSEEGPTNKYEILRICLTDAEYFDAVFPGVLENLEINAAVTDGKHGDILLVVSGNHIS